MRGISSSHTHTHTLFSPSTLLSGLLFISVSGDLVHLKCVCVCECECECVCVCVCVCVCSYGPDVARRRPQAWSRSRCPPAMLPARGQSSYRARGWAGERHHGYCTAAETHTSTQPPHHH